MGGSVAEDVRCSVNVLSGEMLPQPCHGSTSAISAFCKGQRAVIHGRYLKVLQQYAPLLQAVDWTWHGQPVHNLCKSRQLLTHASNCNKLLSSATQQHARDIQALPMCSCYGYVPESQQSPCACRAEQPPPGGLAQAATPGSHSPICALGSGGFCPLRKGQPVCPTYHVLVSV